MVTPEPMVKEPAPRALLLPRFREPPRRLKPPAPLLVPLSVRAPAPVFATAALKVVLPLTVREFTKPVTDHVWELAAVSGAAMVMAPALSPT